MNATFALICALAQPAADPNVERITAAVKDYCDRLHSVRVVATDRAVADGGPFAADPAAKVTYATKGVRGQDGEFWSSPPKFRQRLTEISFSGEGLRSTTSSEVYFDGDVKTTFYPDRKSGFVEDNKPAVSPPFSDPLHAIGFLFPMTYQNKLADLLADPKLVSAIAGPTIDGRSTWEVTVARIPDSLRPQERSEVYRQRCTFKLWVSLEPTVIVHRWAECTPRATSEMVLTGFKLTRRAIPVLDSADFVTAAGYVNLDHAPVRDEMRGGSVLLPRRIFSGNGFGILESTIREFQVNPPETPTTFRPAFPPGIVQARTSSAPVVQGGAGGHEVRVKDITTDAKAMLSSDDALSARSNALTGAVVPLGGAALVIMGLALVALAWRRRDRT